MHFPLRRGRTTLLVISPTFVGHFPRAYAPLTTAADPSSYRQLFEARWGIDAGALNLSDDARVDTWKVLWEPESRK